MLKKRLLFSLFLPIWPESFHSLEKEEVLLLPDKGENLGTTIKKPEVGKAYNFSLQTQACQNKEFFFKMKSFFHNFFFRIKKDKFIFFIGNSGYSNLYDTQVGLSYRYFKLTTKIKQANEVCFVPGLIFENVFFPNNLIEINIPLLYGAQKFYNKNFCDEVYPSVSIGFKKKIKFSFVGVGVFYSHKYIGLQINFKLFGQYIFFYWFFDLKERKFYANSSFQITFFSDPIELLSIINNSIKKKIEEKNFYAKESHIDFINFGKSIIDTGLEDLMKKFYTQTMRDAIKVFFHQEKPDYYYLFDKDSPIKKKNMQSFLKKIRDRKQNSERENKNLDENLNQIQQLKEKNYKDIKNKENVLLSLDDLNDFLEKKIKLIQTCVGDQTKWTKLQIVVVLENIFCRQEQKMSQEETEILFLIGKNLLPTKFLEESGFFFSDKNFGSEIYPSIIREFINIKYVGFGQECYEINVFQNHNRGGDRLEEELTLGNIQEKILEQINNFVQTEKTRLLGVLEKEIEAQQEEERDEEIIGDDSDSIFNIMNDIWEETKLSILMYKIFRQNFDYGLGIFYDPWFLSVNKNLIFNKKIFALIIHTIKTFPGLMGGFLEKYGITREELQQFLGDNKAMEKTLKPNIESICFEHNRKQKKILESLEKIVLKLNKNQQHIAEYNKIGYSEANIRKILNSLIVAWS